MKRLADNPFSVLLEACVVCTAIFYCIQAGALLEAFGLWKKRLVVVEFVLTMAWLVKNKKNDFTLNMVCVSMCLCVCQSVFWNAGLIPEQNHDGSVVWLSCSTCVLRRRQTTVSYTERSTGPPDSWPLQTVVSDHDRMTGRMSPWTQNWELPLCVCVCVCVCVCLYFVCL